MRTIIENSFGGSISVDLTFLDPKMASKRSTKALYSSKGLEKLDFDLFCATKNSKRAYSEALTFDQPPFFTRRPSN